MKRRRFIVSTGSAVLISSGLNSSSKRPTVALDFEIEGVPSKHPSNIDTVLIGFKSFSLIPKYVDESENATVTVTLNIQNHESVSSQQTIQLSNGSPVDKEDIGSTLPIIKKGISSSQDSLFGEVVIELSHPSISDSYRKSFTIASSDLTIQNVVNSSDLLAWWPLQNSAQDVTGNGYDGSSSNVLFGAEAKSGIQGGYFDGSSVINWSPNKNRDFWCLSAWIKPDNWYGSSNNDIISVQDVGGGEPAVRINSNGLHIKGGNNGTGTDSVNPPSPGWAHVVWINDPDSSPPVEFYVNGELTSTGSGADQAINSNSNQKFGNLTGEYNNPYSGILSDVRFYSSRLSENQITDLYQRGIRARDPIDGDARYAFEGNSNDAWSNKNGVEKNDPNYTTDSVIGNRAIDIDSSQNQAIDLPNFSSSFFEKGSFTGWIDADSSVDQFVIWFGTSNNTESRALRVKDGTYDFIGYGNDFDTEVTPSDGYDLITVTWNANRGLARIYKNNADEIGFSNSLNLSQPSSQENAVGYRKPSDAGDLYATAQIDNLRVYPYQLDPHQVKSIYNKWNNITSTSTDLLDSHYKLDGDSINSAGPDNGTNNGVSFVRGIRGRAGSFDGSSEVAFTETNYGTTHTISAWVRHNSQSEEVIGGPTTTNGDNYFIYKNDNNIYYKADGEYVSWSGANYDDNWRMYTIRRNGADVDLFVNAVYQGTKSITSSKECTLSEIGNSAYQPDSYAWTGEIDDVRIYNDKLSDDEIFELYLYGTKGRDLRSYIEN